MEGFSEDDTVVIVDVSTEPVLFSSMPTELLIAPGKHHESHSFTTTASGFPSPFTSATATATDQGAPASEGNGSWTVPPPLPSRTLTEPSGPAVRGYIFATTMSNLPSIFTSATAIDAFGRASRRE